MYLSKIACAGLFVIATLTALPAHAQGEQCVGMENDVARLQCFDAVFNGPEDDLDLYADEAVDKLIKLVNFSDKNIFLRLYAGENVCQIKSVVKYSVSTGLYHNQYIVHSHSDLSKVERIGNWDQQGTYKAIVLYTERGTEGVWARKSNGVRGPVADARLLDISTLKEEKSYFGRDARFALMVPEYYPDVKKIEDALQLAIKACRGGR